MCLSAHAAMAVESYPKLASNDEPHFAAETTPAELFGFGHYPSLRSHELISVTVYSMHQMQRRRMIHWSCRALARPRLGDKCIQ
jgi:hypothetical protein